MTDLHWWNDDYYDEVLPPGYWDPTPDYEFQDLDQPEQAEDYGVNGDSRPADDVPCITKTPEPHLAGEFPMSCYQCHIVADS